MKNAAAESKLNFIKALTKHLIRHRSSNPSTFARTGVNGIATTMKYTPGLNLAEETADILMASPDNLDEVLQYGIKNAEDLANEKHYNLVVKPLVLPSPLLPLRHT